MSRINPYWTFGWETASALSAASLTIGARVVRMQQAMLRGDLSGGPEAHRMVAEKVKAAGEGYFAGMAAMTDLMTAPPTSAEDMWNAAAKVGRASTKPGYAKARANARRLSKILP